MGLELPSELTEPLGWIGLIWPQADEEKLFEAGQTWLSFGATLRGQAQTTNDAAAQVWSANQGDAADAFQTWWNADKGPGPNLADNAAAAELVGAALLVMAGITLALKVTFIAQLITLAIEVAQAIASAFATFGATTAEIPGFIALTRTICREAVDKVISIVEREIAKLLEQAAKLFEKVGAKDLAKGTEKFAGKFAGQAQDRMFANLFSKAERMDVSTPHDGANFWSGRDASGKGMRQYAEENVDGVNQKILEQTEGGKYFDDLDLYGTNSGLVNDSQRTDLWGKLSERYGENATGEVTAWVHNPRPGSFWSGTELPALRTNPAVTGIKEYDPVTGSTTILDPNP